MNVLRSLAERLIRIAGPDATNDLLRSLLRGYEHLSYRRLRNLGFRPSTIFDVGAFHGDWSLGARQIFPDAKIIMVEAQPMLRDPLERVASRLGNASVYNTLVSANAQEEVTFYSMGTGSSVKPERSDAGREVLQIASTTLDHIWRAESPIRGPVFVKIDVQGYELDVLAGASEVLENTEWFQLESALLAYNEGAPQLQEVCNFMADHGFSATEVTGFSRPGDHLVQIDLLFARDGSTLRPDRFAF
ncbi:MAG: FkbM family methyltransferase [Novosphingobium sp.]